MKHALLFTALLSFAAPLAQAADPTPEPAAAPHTGSKLPTFDDFARVHAYLTVAEQRGIPLEDALKPEGFTVPEYAAAARPWINAMKRASQGDGDHAAMQATIARYQAMYRKQYGLD